MQCVHTEEVTNVRMLIEMTFVNGGDSFRNLYIYKKSVTYFIQSMFELCPSTARQCTHWYILNTYYGVMFNKVLALAYFALKVS